jgi:hypothetical protein
MHIDRPYKRICRPFVDGNFLQSFDSFYVRDSRYAPDYVDFVRAYHLLEVELKRIFDYVEPADANLSCYSHQLYALLLRACTEFESNAKAVLVANGYSVGRNLNIVDYHKLNAAMRLSDYAVRIPIWNGQARRVEPFRTWRAGPTLSWYQSYNASKHDRALNFSHASLENAVMAVSAVFCISFAQFCMFAFDPFHPVSSFNIDQDDSVWSHEACMLAVEPPSTWLDHEKYNFDWPTLSSRPDAFQTFCF